MPDLQNYVKAQIAKIVPGFETLELKATVNDASYSVEFFVMINGEKKQCYELVDDGIVDEDKLDEVLAQIAEFIRKSPDYKKGTINKVSL